MHPFTRKAALACAAFGAMSLAALSAPAHATDAVDPGCKLRYPIVLSHHWAMRELCPTKGPATGPSACAKVEDYARYCVQKMQDAQGQPTCGAWRVTPEEEALPPRNINLVDGGLHRDVSAYHRYFSQAIVSRLRDTCGNAVYIADKPAYASYEVRARSLRNTVNEALAREQAQKVIVVGLSQGVQDARYMTAKLLVDDADPAQGTMKSRVAAVVGLSGEDGGAESATLALTTLQLVNGGNWADYPKAIALIGDRNVNDAAWKRNVDGREVSVLGEQCRGGECDLALEDRYQWALRSLFDLSTFHMRPSQAQLAPASQAKWRELMAYLNLDQAHWAEQVPPSLEADNGVEYLSYGAHVMQWEAAWGGVFSQDFLFYASISLSDGANDAYVSLRRQRYANTAGNFHHIKTMQGAWWGHGYHHMFFAGRNDQLYAPPAAAQEADAYKGGAADFYQQMARDLKARGF